MGCVNTKGSLNSQVTTQTHNATENRVVKSPAPEPKVANNYPIRA